MLIVRITIVAAAVGCAWGLIPQRLHGGSYNYRCLYGIHVSVHIAMKMYACISCVLIQAVESIHLHDSECLSM